MVDSTEAFVTIFDKNFIPQALIMHKSLITNFENAFLYVFCLDKYAFKKLTELKLERIEILNISEFESIELLEAKKLRTSGEYAWTLTPFLPTFLFSILPNLKRVTYIDADLFFFKSPITLIKEFELSKKKILFTPHDFEKNQDLSADVGKYCVQFMTFNRNSTNFLKWWQNKCLEWCYAKIENGRFGDQKYLDEARELFDSDIFELLNTKYAQGPWNTNKFNTIDAIFFHFHGLRICQNFIYLYTIKKVKRESFEFFYKPYVNQIRNLYKNDNSLITQTCQISTYQYSYLKSKKIKNILLKLIKRFIYKNEKLIYFD